MLFLASCSIKVFVINKFGADSTILYPLNQIRYTGQLGKNTKIRYILKTSPIGNILGNQAIKKKAAKYYIQNPEQ